jgi:hypothetical protein
LGSLNRLQQASKVTHLPKISQYGDVLKTGYLGDVVKYLLQQKVAQNLVISLG